MSYFNVYFKNKNIFTAIHNYLKNHAKNSNLLIRCLTVAFSRSLQAAMIISGGVELAEICLTSSSPNPLLLPVTNTLRESIVRLEGARLPEWWQILSQRAWIWRCSDCTNAEFRKYEQTDEMCKGRISSPGRNLIITDKIWFYVIKNIFKI